MSAAVLLDRLEVVRSTGPGRWVARCPAHVDRSPSLSIRELDDGRVLIHDFAGCDVESVLEAVGLDWAALFPPRDPSTHRTRRAPPVPFDDVLRCIAAEVWHVLLCAGRIESGETLTPADLDRLTLATDRIQAAARLARIIP